jgi:hypothetical protein
MKLAGKTFLNFSLYKFVAHNPLSALRISALIRLTDWPSSKTPEDAGRSGEVTAVTLRSLLVFEILTDNLGVSRSKIKHQASKHQLLYVLFEIIYHPLHG